MKTGKILYYSTETAVFVEKIEFMRYNIQFNFSDILTFIKNEFKFCTNFLFTTLYQNESPKKVMEMKYQGEY